ncbi:hypothetical protein Tco_0683615 [Tanacetum coccineum]
MTTTIGYLAQLCVQFIPDNEARGKVTEHPDSDNGENATMEQIMKRNKWRNADYVCRDSLDAKYMVDDASSKKILASNFTSVMKQYNELLERFQTHLIRRRNFVELGSHLRIEESPRVQDNDKTKGNNVVGPLVVNMLKHNNSSRDYKGVNVGSKTNGSGTSGSGNGSVPLKGAIVRDEALDKFKVFKTEVELQQGSLIKRLRTNRGGEYMDTQYFQSIGIIYEKAAPVLHNKICIKDLDITLSVSFALPIIIREFDRILLF